MAIYVDLSHKDIERFLSGYEIGALQSFKGIAKGVSNTNYLVVTTQEQYILTLFEERRTRGEDLPFIFDWSEHLNGKGIHCPRALVNRNGERFHKLKDKAAVLVNFLEGTDIPRGQTNTEHCRKMGAFTARLHQASEDFKQTRGNDWPLERFKNILEHHADRIKAYSDKVSNLIQDELSFQTSQNLDHLPSGVVHTDLFPDNIFFKNGEISAVIDMYFACTHAYTYDLAIVINAWCFDGQGAFQPEQYKALLEGYNAVRHLTPEEQQNFQTILRLASLRFLMSRLEEWVTHDPKNTLMQPHNPAEYIERLLFHRQHDIMAS